MKRLAGWWRNRQTGDSVLQARTGTIGCAFRTISVQEGQENSSLSGAVETTT
jgi:hypothetical protein